MSFQLPFFHTPKKTAIRTLLVYKNLVIFVKPFETANQRRQCNELTHLCRGVSTQKEKTPDCLFLEKKG